ncbi:hypothetical protein Syun_011947 [Stephania yunnanensis]|uniref:Uncharacterized protein n=1 Tax=Stephania yunnanensis TaxID=152371 RepID=A0AAP0K0Z3_9MAGN
MSFHSICSKYRLGTTHWSSIKSEEVLAGFERILASSPSKIEKVWLQGNGKFLLGSGHHLLQISACLRDYAIGEMYPERCSSRALVESA